MWLSTTTQATLLIVHNLANGSVCFDNIDTSPQGTNVTTAKGNNCQSKDGSLSVSFLLPKDSPASKTVLRVFNIRFFCLAHKNHNHQRPSNAHTHGPSLTMSGSLSSLDINPMSMAAAESSILTKSKSNSHQSMHKHMHPHPHLAPPV